MSEMKHQRKLDLISSFPQQYPSILPRQKEGLEVIAKTGKSAILELPTGTGKTAVGYTFLKALQKQGAAPLFYIAPTKTLVEQVKFMHPDVQIAYGRNDHSCLYYPGESLKADEIPCSLLIDCPHRVDQETGRTFQEGAIPCPYLLQKYEAKKSGIVVCTAAFYLFTQLFSREWQKPAGLVIDEAHRMAQVVRSVLSYEITDYHLKRSGELLEDIGADEAQTLNDFLKTMMKIIRSKPVKTPTILEDDEVKKLLNILLQINPAGLKAKVAAAIKEGKIDTREKRELLKKLEVLTQDIYHYITSLEFSLPTDDRQPLNYTFAFYKKEITGNEKVQYSLHIKAYYVAPLIKKLLSPFTVSYSATIGDARIFGFETGIKAPFYSFGSDFPAENARIFMPTDTPNLAVKERRRQDLTKILRRIARACKNFADKNLRSLVVVISEKERQKFLELCREEKVEAVSYGNGLTAKESALKFKAGEGKVLVGTAANYGEGVDLPRQTAPVIFFLRPGYPSPTDPATAFEERRFGGQRWKIWNWRVMIEALQVRGRNIRSAEDLGVTFFISQQFRRFLFASLPEWLQDAYCGNLTFDECIKEMKKVLKSR